ncbi:MAG: hypothetical protein M3211_04075 [Actinomycetota bacterium]|nr:hypothetical protein [Actinomycetota bacterium]
MPVAALLVTPAACGEAQPAPSASDARSAASPDHQGHGYGHHRHGGGGPRTPAYLVPGDVRTGLFAALPGAPRTASDISGSAWVTENAKGTTLTLEVTGLRPSSQYVGHLHTQPCNQDDGGPHFAFDPAGPKQTPNGMYLGVTADQRGNGITTGKKPRGVGEGAQAVVLHNATGGSRLVCADLSPAPTT